MTRLIVGFDSAWTPGKRGAITAALRHDDGRLQALGMPRAVNFPEATADITLWQELWSPRSTIILIDQPTIVANAKGQRPVENIVSASVSRRRGGMQPASTGRTEMFGTGAPVWPFLAQFGGATDPISPPDRTNVVLETYPVLALIALHCLQKDSRASGRLPKYNPERRKTFQLDDWRFVCDMASAYLGRRGLVQTADWIDVLRAKEKPTKVDQDMLDACLCLLVAVHVAEGAACLMVGDTRSGYIIVPYCEKLHAELDARCDVTGKTGAEWVRRLAFSYG